MIKTYKKTSLIVFVCIFTMLLSAGCAQKTNNIINTEELSIMMNKKENTSNQETVKINNGVIIYRDNVRTSTPAGYSQVNFKPVKPIEFGPSELHFAPKNVHPKQ